MSWCSSAITPGRDCAGRSFAPGAGSAGRNARPAKPRTGERSAVDGIAKQVPGKGREQVTRAREPSRFNHLSEAGHPLPPPPFCASADAFRDSTGS
jgi:hypothetical protein